MKASELVKIAKKIANEPTVYYSVAGGDWCKWNGSKWNMDCVCMIKGILWGFNFNKKASHGGAVYGSNGVKDDNADGIMKRCTKVSKDFSNIEVGEILHMDGHVGIYIGDRKVVEATAAWDYKVQISDVATNGKRSKNGVSAGYWKEHGKLQYVEYDTPKPTLTPTKSIDEVAKEVIEGKWGNGEERKKKLRAAGYSYTAVQNKVNELMDTPKTITYTVKKGDTLTDIAAKYNTTVSKIAKDNNIKNVHIIYIGQKLIIKG